MPRYITLKEGIEGSIQQFKGLLITICSLKKYSLRKVY